MCSSNMCGDNAAAGAIILKSYQQRRRNEPLRMTADFQPSNASAHAAYVHECIYTQKFQGSPCSGVR